MKEIWTKPRVPFEGRVARIAEAGGVGPHPARQPHIPIWIGGHGDAALRRVVAVGDGWHPLGLRPPGEPAPAGDGSQGAATARDGRPRGTRSGCHHDLVQAPLKFEEAAGTRTPLAGSSSQIVEDLQAYVAAGVQHFVLDFSVAAVPAMLDVLERFAADVRPKVGEPPR